MFLVSQCVQYCVHSIMRTVCVRCVSRCVCAQYVCVHSMCVHSMYVRARVLLPWLFSPGPRPIRRTCPTLPPRRDQRPSLRRASPAVGARRVTGRTSRRTGSRRRGRRNRKRYTCGERGAERGARTLSLHVLAYSEARRTRALLSLHVRVLHTRASLSLHVRVLHTYSIPYMYNVRVDAPHTWWVSLSFSHPIVLFHIPLDERVEDRPVDVCAVGGEGCDHGGEDPAGEGARHRYRLQILH